jgi:dynein heavy chain
MAAKILDGVQTKRPELEAFDEKITFLNRVKNDISQMNTSVDIGWLRVNVNPLIKELHNTVTRWIDTYTSFLLDNTVKQIENIDNFIKNVDQGIQKLPVGSNTKEDKELLMMVMTHLSDVKQIKDRTLETIEPMKQTIQLLKKHQLPMNIEYLVELENSKTKLVDVSMNALGPVKEKILPMQTKEASNIKSRLLKFEIKVGEFRLEFGMNVPQNIQDISEEIIQKSYEKIAEYYIRTCELELEAEELNNLEILFDIQKSSYKQLKDCRNELVNLKYMWDLIALIEY